MNANESTVELLILHTNDLHSQFEAMAPLQTVLHTYGRQLAEAAVLRFDIGDHMDRVRPETEGSFGSVNIDVMNAAGYDAAVLGNNEGLTFPAAVLDKLYGEQAHFPVLTTNLIRLERDAPVWGKRGIVLERCGMRIGVVGVTAAYNDFYIPLGWKALEPIAAASEEALRLRSEQGADLVIALSHLGITMDRRMAEQAPGIDLILGGHTHHVLEELLNIGGVYVGAAGKLGSHIGVVRIEMDRRTRQILRCTGGAVDMRGQEPDAVVASLIASRSEAARASLNRTVARIEEPLPSDYDEESPLGNLLAAALRRLGNADIGLVNAGQLMGGLEAGDITAARLHAICPAPINPCVLTLRGEDIYRAVEQSLETEFKQRVIRGFGFRGERLGTLCVDGMSVEVAADVTANDSVSSKPEIRLITVGGEPLEPQRAYRVGTIDMFTFRVGYESLANGDHITYFLEHFIRDVIADTLNDPQQKRYIADAKVPRFLFYR